MRHFMTCAAAALTFATALPALGVAADTYVLDPAHTNIYWASSHMGFSTVSGKFADPEGKIILDEAAPEKSVIEVTVHTDKILTGVPKFDEHLRSKDFFDSEHFPTATFKSKKVEVIEKNSTAKVTGDFTLRGITKELTLDVKLNKMGENPFTKKQSVGFGAKGMFKRSDYGITYAAPAVPDQVALHIQLEAYKEETEAAKPAADAHGEAKPAADAHGEAKPAADAHGEAKPADAHGEAKPADAHGEAKPADAHGEAKPADAHGEAKPADAHGEAKPADAHGEAKPADAHGEAKPADAHGEAKPADAHGEAKPADAHGEAKPADAHGEAKPADAHGEAKPADAHGEAKPADAHGEAKPADAHGEAKPADAHGEAKPADAHGEAKPADAHGEAKPAADAHGEAKPAADAHH